MVIVLDLVILVHLQRILCRHQLFGHWVGHLKWGRECDRPIIFTDMGHKPCLFLRLKTDERLRREVYDENNLDESIGETMWNGMNYL